MPRRRIILPTLFLLLTTFVIAVQHDTFIRRWCLPTPPPATRPVGPLDQVIDEFVVDDAHGPDVVRELERRASVRIGGYEIDWAFATDSAISARRLRPSCVIRGATVEQLSCRILIPNKLHLTDDLFTTGENGSVNVSKPTIGARQMAIRVHNVDPTLLRPDVQWTGFAPWNGWSSGRDRIRYVDWLTLHYVATGRLGQDIGLERDPVLRFGDKLIVLTTPRSHWLIDQILHEEAEAQHANRNPPAATRPTQ